MKKRAIISAVAGIALAGVMAVGFAACGDDSDKGGKGDGGDEVEVTAKDIVSDVVDEETWDIAMDFESFENYKGTYSGERKVQYAEGTVTIKMEYTIAFEDGKQYVKGKDTTTFSGTIPEEEKANYTVGEQAVEFYIQDDEVIAQKDGNWTKITSEAEIFAKYYMDAYIFYGYFDEREFDQYEYKEARKGYVMKDAEGGAVLVAKIKDGKLKACCIEAPLSSNETLKMDVLYSYGGQSVSVPEV